MMQGPTVLRVQMPTTKPSLPSYGSRHGTHPFPHAVSLPRNTIRGKKFVPDATQCHPGIEWPGRRKSLDGKQLLLGFACRRQFRTSRRGLDRSGTRRAWVACRHTAQPWVGMVLGTKMPSASLRSVTACHPTRFSFPLSALRFPPHPTGNRSPSPSSGGRANRCSKRRIAISKASGPSSWSETGNSRSWLTNRRVGGESDFMRSRRAAR